MHEIYMYPEYTPGPALGGGSCVTRPSEKRMPDATKHDALVFFRLEKCLADALGPHSHRSRRLFGYCETVQDAGSLLGPDLRDHCDAVHAWSVLDHCETALYRHGAGCSIRRVADKLF